MSAKLPWRVKVLLHNKIQDVGESDFTNLHITKSPEHIIAEMKLEMEDFLSRVQTSNNPLIQQANEYSAKRCREDVKNILDHKEEAIQVINEMIQEFNGLADLAQQAVLDIAINAIKKN